MNDEYKVLTRKQMYEKIQEIAVLYKEKKDAIKNELNTLSKEIEATTIILNEIKTIEAGVSLGLLKNFKIKKVMVPSEYDSREEMESALADKISKLTDLEDDLNNDRIIRLPLGFFRPAFIRNLIDPGFTSSHFNPVIVDMNYGEWKPSVAPNSTLSMIFLGYWDDESADWGEYEVMKIDEVESYDSLRLAFEERIDFLLSQEDLDSSMRATLIMAKPRISAIKDSVLLSFIGELYENNFITLGAFPAYEELKDEEARSLGIDTENESRMDRRARLVSGEHTVSREEIFEFLYHLAGNK